MEPWQALILASLLIVAVPVGAEPTEPLEEAGPPCQIWQVYTNPPSVDVHTECLSAWPFS